MTRETDDILTLVKFLNLSPLNQRFVRYIEKHGHPFETCVWFVCDWPFPGEYDDPTKVKFFWHKRFQDYERKYHDQATTDRQPASPSLGPDPSGGPDGSVRRG